MVSAMTPDRNKAARELLAFYQEAGVDALVGETPVDRFADASARGSAPSAPLPAAEVERPKTAPDRAASAAPPFQAREVLARDLDARGRVSAAPPAPDAAVMAAREAAKTAA